LAFSELGHSLMYFVEFSAALHGKCKALGTTDYANIADTEDKRNKENEGKEGFAFSLDSHPFVFYLRPVPTVRPIRHDF
jgi:hypothetical protein